MSNAKNLGRIALYIGLVGLLLAVFVGMLGRLIERDLRGLAFLVFVGAQVAAIVLGLMARNTPFGKAAAITSSALLIGSLTMVA